MASFLNEKEEEKIKMDCIFCKIANGEIPSYTLYEDENILAILDISPVSKGHTLIMPKKHYENILFCDEKTMESMSKAIQVIGKALLKKAKGLNVLSNIHSCAGQSVMHAHVHLIPVDENDRHVQFSFSELTNIDLKKVQDELISLMGK